MTFQLQISDLTHLHMDILRAEALNQGLNAHRIRRKADLIQQLVDIINPQIDTIELTEPIRQIIQHRRDNQEPTQSIYTISELDHMLAPNLNRLARSLRVGVTGGKMVVLQRVAQTLMAQGQLNPNEHQYVDNPLFWYYFGLTNSQFRTVLLDHHIDITGTKVDQIAALLRHDNRFLRRYSASELYRLNLRGLTLLGQALGLPDDQLTDNRNTVLANVINRLQSQNLISQQDLTMMRSDIFRRLIALDSTQIHRLRVAYGLNAGNNVDAAIALYNNGVLRDDLVRIQHQLIPIRSRSHIRVGNSGHPAGELDDQDFDVPSPEPQHFSPHIDIPPPRIPPHGVASPRPSDVTVGNVQDILKTCGLSSTNETVTDTNNPYSYLTSRQLRAIMEERDVTASGSHELQQLDQIYPDWFQNVISTPIHRLQNLTKPQQYVYAGVNHIDLRSRDVRAMNSQQLAGYIRCRIIAPPILREPPEDNQKLYTTSAENQTFREAIVQTNQGVVLNANNLKAISENDLVNTLQEIAIYPLRVSPEHYMLLRTEDTYMLRRCVLDLMPPDLHLEAHLLDKPQLIFVLSHGYYPPHIDLQALRERYQQLRQEPEWIRTNLIELYQFNDNVPYLPLHYVASQTPHPLELVIHAAKNYPLTELAKAVGMVIPTNENVDRYFRQNILHYRETVTRPAGLSEFTPMELMKLSPDNLRHALSRYADEEIFQLSGLYFHYTSRLDIINQIVNLQVTPRFFIPLTRRCKNPETFLGTSTRDLTVPIIGYGTLTDYFGYESDELLHSFTYYGEEELQSFVFKSPDLTTIYSIETIRQLLETIRSHPEFEELIRQIDLGLMLQLEKTQYDNRILREFKSLTQKDQYRSSIRDLFYRLFYSGMYMRRWKGPGHPYPLGMEQTKVKMSPDDNVISALGELAHLLDSFPSEIRHFLVELRKIEFHGNQMDQSPRSIGELLGQVGTHNYCIRMASSILVGTGFYYLRLLYNEIIPNFDPSKVMIIS